MSAPETSHESPTSERPKLKGLRFSKAGNDSTALELSSPLMLSPMAGYTILPTRVCMRAAGGLSMATTDLVSARSLLELNPKGIEMIASCSQDRPLGVQLFGANKQELRDAARFLEDLGVDLIDINMGCPASKVNKSGSGAALMQDEELTEELVTEIVQAVDIPVTVKMRLGWDKDSINAHEIAPRLEQMGVAAVAVHGRTREQGFTGSVNLEGIRAVVESVKRIPVIGNGDVKTHLDAERMIHQIGCAGVMVGRAGLSDPFFFDQTLRYLREGTEPQEVPLDSRFRYMHFHFAACMKYRGEHGACILFRKFMTGHSEYFPKREPWRAQTQQLSSLDEYWDTVRRLTPRELLKDAEDILDCDLHDMGSFLDSRGEFKYHGYQR